MTSAAFAQNTSCSSSQPSRKVNRARNFIPLFYHALWESTIFHCKGCVAKDAHIADLQKQLEQLSRFVMPPAPKSNALPIIEIEREKILNGDHEPIDVQGYELSPDDDVQGEADRILTGNY